MTDALVMSRRTFVGATMGAPAVLRANARAASRPNILLLMTDQHRADCLGAAGNRLIHTPNLDRLAQEGVLFRNAYSTTPTCTPARSALLTGQGPWSHGMLGYGELAPSYPVEMPQLLREAGYYTIGVGKMHWNPPRALHGFHRTILDEATPLDGSGAFRTDYEGWFYSQAPGGNPYSTGLLWNDYRSRPFALPERLHPTTWTADTAVRFLEGYNAPEPFFLKASFLRPHSPYDPPERFLRMYRDAELPPARVGGWAAGNNRRAGSELEPWRGDLGAAQVRASRQGYYASVSHVDEQIGRILETLQRRKMWDNTLIVMLSDHGDMLGDHHLWRKSYAYQGSARIPMMLHWPEGMVAARRGGVLEQPVEIRDVLPTLLDAAGARIPEAVEGASLLNLVRNPNHHWRSHIDLEHNTCYDASNHWNGLTDGRRKFIFHAQTGAVQLFDLERDPDELTDLAGDPAHAGQVRTWRNRLIQHLAPRGEDWVRNGELAPRPGSLLYSPNYPVKRN